MSGKKYFTQSKLAICIAAISLNVHVLQAQEETVELEDFITEEEVNDDLGLLPTEPVESVFGFGKTILETPRSVSSVSASMIDAYNINDIDDLVVVSPGAFTQSFFGVAGSLDVRGTAGEVYFRGMRRLDNPGNYPTPLGASDRIDIVRGPATPVMGPSKIGGYINFVPKSARAETGQYLEEPTGKITATRGSWEKNISTWEVGGPASIASQDLGYYVYIETENSDSFYENSDTDQNVYQASFNMDLGASTRIEFGGMYHEFDGNQVAGWNRLTQDLIDNGTYITGSPAALDTDGDGSISHLEYSECDCFGVLEDDDGNPFIPFIPLDDQGLIAETVGEATLDHSQVLVAPDDVLLNDSLTLYFDLIHELDSGWTLTNKLFYDAYENLNENAYGFSQFHDSYVIENKLIFEYGFDTSSMTGAVQISPSIRHTDFEHGDDFINEYFDRRDLTGPSTALDRRLLATRIDDDYSEFYEGSYTDYGFGVMGDFSFDFGLNALIGLRYDSIEMDSFTPDDKLLFGDGADDFAEATEDGVSWTTSFSWKTPIGLTPYITASKQITVIAGQGADISVDNIAEGTAVDDSNLLEIGFKGSFLDDRLYTALTFFEQDRTDFNAQSSITNESVETTGTEFELRYLVNEALTLTASATAIEIVNLNTGENGGRFTFLGAEDFEDFGVADIAAGAPATFTSGPAEKAGIPEQSYSLTLHYSFLESYAFTMSYFHADETPSGFTGSVTLPSYDLFNMGLSYRGTSWDASLNIKNLTNETYYRSNFPNLFGSQIVLPELPRHWEASIAYKF